MIEWQQWENRHKNMKHDLEKDPNQIKMNILKEYYESRTK